MKKTWIYSFVLLLAGVSGWSVDTADTQKIECKFRHFNRENVRSLGSSPFVSVRESASPNWSGYVAAPNLSYPINSSVNDVSGSWTIPTLNPMDGRTYCAIWVGIDGYVSNTVQQIGTSHNWIAGKQQNYAWFEMYPKGAYQIVGFPVDNGDVVSAGVTYEGNDTYVLTLINNTKGVHTVVPTTYTKTKAGKRASAEWVVEAPAMAGKILPLANFGATTFSNCFANIGGITGTINGGSWAADAIVMESKKGVVKAQPSDLMESGHTFQVAWAHQ